MTMNNKVSPPRPAVRHPQRPGRASAALSAGALTRNAVFIVMMAVILWRVPYQLSNDYQLRVATLLVIYAVFTVGLEFAMGRAGQVSLGHGGLFAVGAYTEAVLQTKHGFEAWTALLVAVGFGAVAGLVLGLPALRVRGPYLAVVTIGFGLAIQALIYVFPRLTNGASGIGGVGYLGSIGLGNDALGTYYGALAVLVVALLLLLACSWGRFGQALLVMSESVTLARANGVSVPAVKLGMFAVSAAVASAAGACFATLGFISPDSFSLQLSVFPVVALVLGGISTIPGPVIGAFILYGFDQVAGRSAQGSALMYGILLMVVPLLLSRGLTGLIIRAARWLRASVTGSAAEPVGAAAGPRTTSVGVVEPDEIGRGVALVVRGASKHFGSLKAVDDVSIEVRPGEILGLVGPNGSGKSTLLNLISGYYPLTSGDLVYDGSSVASTPFHKRVRRGILTAFQSAQLMNSRTVGENLAVGAVASARWGRALPSARCAEILAELDSSLALSTTVGTLPEGSRKIVELGRTLLARPRLLLLDEPTSGLSLEEVQRVSNVLLEIKKLGITVVLADHNFEFVASVCERLVVLESGRILAEGPAQLLQVDERVVAAYLGAGMSKRGEPGDGDIAD
jgi:ABC-type branched-subunit amino acid transport system ATPase component/ABC-type branched-subunit amino acid transport system permease subunit